MKSTWLFFVLATVLCWGTYVPMLHYGQMSFLKPPASLRAFLLVGVAYFLVAVLVPVLLLVRNAEPAVFNSKGVSFSLIAGVLGALGALGIILAIRNGGKPVYVAPLVFAGAPIVNTIISMIWHKPANTPDARFFVGIALAAVGALMVLMYKPS